MINVNWETGAESFIDAVASNSAVPGGGAAASVVAATGCGLCMMAVAITMKMKSDRK
ncbi:MAG: cyclodeaminase/cyclohydrolase family protein, partial [Elusimicrobiota bacterium]|nr:cyclodeaminase/cyclohydrolase family protein [Elusimicrobiota bacterium]